MRASTGAFVKTTRTARLVISSRSQPRLTQSHPASIKRFSLFALVACTTKSACTGHHAPNLSNVNPGQLRATIGLTTGEPELVAQLDSAVVAGYVIDRGFVGTLEKNSIGEKILWAPVMARGDPASPGLAGWLVACATPSQNCWLVVRYDEDNRPSSSTSEVFPPDEHPPVAECASSAVRADIGVCQNVQERVSPSSLPSKGKAPGNDRSGEQKGNMKR